jgi:hypothetical protein
VKSIIISLLLLVVVAAYLWPGNETKYAPGVLVPDEPSQTLISRPTPWAAKGYRVTPLADFRLSGRVLMMDRYWLGRESDLSPEDLTLGWRRMSDQAVLDRMSFVREHRAYNFRPRGSDWPIPLAEIISHTANLHMIPATAGVEEKLKSVRRGNLVELSGYLVQVDAPDGWHWRSSLSRTDTGPGACELVWVNWLAAR